MRVLREPLTKNGATETTWDAEKKEGDVAGLGR
jgi:hypothetical protein